MSGIKGKLISCDRCGHEHFLKYTGEGESDGGYTRWDKFEDLPEDWLWESEIGYLCPHCAGIFRAFIHKFMDCDQKRIAPHWKMQPGDEGFVNTITF